MAQSEAGSLGRQTRARGRDVDSLQADVHVASWPATNKMPRDHDDPITPSEDCRVWRFPMRDGITLRHIYTDSQPPRCPPSVDLHEMAAANYVFGRLETDDSACRAIPLPWSWTWVFTSRPDSPGRRVVYQVAHLSTKGCRMVSGLPARVQEVVGGFARGSTRDDRVKRIDKAESVPLFILFVDSKRDYVVSP